MAAATAWLIAAVLVQGLIAAVLLLALGAIRLPLVHAGRIKVDDVALSRDPWPIQEKRVSNAFDNQFQLPVLFYVACGLALYFGPGALEAILAWLFVLTRIAHAAVFATTNNVGQRFAAYSLGFAVLGILWIDLAVRLVLVASGSH